MNILEKLDNHKNHFEAIKAAIIEREKAIKEHKEEIDQYREELNRIQGGYRVLVELGKEEGLLDEDGNLIINEPEVIEEAEEVK